MRPIAQASESPNQLLFLPGMFNETLALLFDAHNYFQLRGIDEQSRLSAKARPIYVGEMTRITTRLTGVMAWIMVRRAVYAGRIEQDKAADQYRLDDAAELELAEMPLDEMPAYLSYLSQQSRQLYERVQRLDRLAYEN